MAKKFKRYLTHNAGTGRDTGHRDIAVPEKTFANNWCATFGHRIPEDSTRCTACGWEPELIRRPARFHSPADFDRQ